eukprot:scaffold3577_cov414-Prasinococcus_capsulatus_cf.AAC.11
MLVGSDMSTSLHLSSTAAQSCRLPLHSEMLSTTLRRSSLARSSSAPVASDKGGLSSVRVLLVSSASTILSDLSSEPRPPHSLRTLPGRVAPSASHRRRSTGLVNRSSVAAWIDSGVTAAALNRTHQGIRPEVARIDLNLCAVASRHEEQSVLNALGHLSSREHAGVVRPLPLPLPLGA